MESGRWRSGKTDEKGLAGRAGDEASEDEDEVLEKEWGVEEVSESEEKGSERVCKEVANPQGVGSVNETPESWRCWRA